MKVSIFTPTHDLKYIQEAYRSLLKQTYKQWEWVILPNGKVKWDDFPGDMRTDFKVKILPHIKGAAIGALKGIACQGCTGELLVELDHDDYLVPTALAKIVKAYKETEAGFIYSDCIHFRPDHSSEVFPAHNGWRTYKRKFNGKEYEIMNTFEAHPRSLCQIFWAPNHVRVWSRKAYDAVGGYDTGLQLADDHDMMCRTYLSGAIFHHINEPLYWYRCYPENSFRLRQKEVQDQQLANMNRFIYPLWMEWSKRECLSAIDLGGAFNCPKEDGFRSLDIHQWPEVDIVADVRNHLPIADNSVGVYRAVDFFEHIEPEKFPFMMNELYRTLAPGGLIMSNTPSVTGPDGRVGLGAFQDPTHRNFFSPNNWWYVTRKAQAQFVPEIQCRFQSVRVWVDYPSQFHHDNQLPYLHADLMAIKGDAIPPGGCQI